MRIRFSEQLTPECQYRYLSNNLPNILHLLVDSFRLSREDTNTATMEPVRAALTTNVESKQGDR
jgi:hypothetical protein